MVTVYIGGLNTTIDNNLLNHFVTTDQDIQIETEATEIIISANSFNDVDMTVYRLRGMVSILSVNISSDCFSYVTDVVFEGLNSLQSITIGSGSFFNADKLTMIGLIDLIELI